MLEKQCDRGKHGEEPDCKDRDEGFAQSAVDPIGLRIKAGGCDVDYLDKEINGDYRQNQYPHVHQGVASGADLKEEHFVRWGIGWLGGEGGDRSGEGDSLVVFPRLVGEVGAAWFLLIHRFDRSLMPLPSSFSGSCMAVGSLRRSA